MDVIGTSKGKGFQGAVKVWHFHGQPATHGAMGHRVPGSIGSSAYPSRTLKGLKHGQARGQRQSHGARPGSRESQPDKNLLLVKGAVPGYNGAFVIVKTVRRLT